MQEEYLAQAEASGHDYARRRVQRSKIGWVGIINSINYHPIFGKGDDGWDTELRFQSRLVNTFATGYLNERDAQKGKRCV
jgi:hypothetical protein